MPGPSRNGRKGGPNRVQNLNVDQAIRVNDSTELTSDQVMPVSDDQNSLRAGVRGPGLLEDFLLREKIIHFDHERIPERIVHARGAGPHGVFQV